MSPTIESIMRYRHIARCIMRAVGLVFGGLAVAPLASWGLEGLRDGDLLDFGYYAPRIIMSVVLLGFGLVFSLLDGVLATWIVPLPSSVCPRCQSMLDPRGAARCPECGLPLVAEPGVPPHDPPPRTAVRAERADPTGGGHD